MFVNEFTDIDFERLRKLVYRFTGISLSDTKRQLLKSRLQRRLRALDLDSYSAYHDLVRDQGPQGPEAVEFINAVTTNKTDFFRESHHFDFVAQHALPEFARAGAKKISIWHAGCSTGEEPYTLGLVLAQTAERYGLDYRQLATDIDTNVLEFAEQGIYDEDRLGPISQDLLRRYVLRGKGEQAGRYRVCRQLREPLAFRRLNLMDEPWPLKADTRFHLIFCRNVLIYFDKPTQDRLFERFHERLEPGGYLLLGHSESMHGHTELYRNVGKTTFKALTPSKGASHAAA